MMTAARRRLWGFTVGLALALTVAGVALATFFADVAEGQNAPSTPTGLRALAGNGQVLLVWNLSTDTSITGYKYRWRNHTDGTAWTDVAMANTDDETFHFLITGLDNGDEYRYTVKATNANGDSSASNSCADESTFFCTATPSASATAPAAPTGLTASAGNLVAGVTLSWTDPNDNGIGYYQVKRDSGTWADIAGSDEDTASHIVTGLANNTGYSFQVRAVNAAGTSAASASASANTNTVPGQVTGLSASAGSQRVQLSWTAVTATPAVTRYEYCQDADCNNYSLISGLTRNTRRTTTGVFSSDEWLLRRNSGDTYSLYIWQGSPLTVGTAYTIDLDGNEYSLGNLVSQENPPFTNSVIYTFNNVTSLGTLNISENTVWSAGSNDRTLKVGTPKAQVWSSTGGAGTTYTKTGLTDGTAYTFRVRAVNAVGNGSQSVAVSATPFSAPAAPAGLAAALSVNRGITLSWTNPNDSTITKYQYRRAATENGLTSATWQDLPGSGASTVSYTQSNLTASATYWYDLRAVNNSGNSADSANVSATIAQLPSAPAGLTATAGNAQVVLTWTNPNNSTITGYSYRQATTQAGLTSATWTAISNSGASTTSFTKTGLTNGTAYWFDIRAVNYSGNSPDSADVSATPLPAPSAPTGLTATAGNAQVVLAWTNPNNSTITGYSYRQATTQAGLTSATWTAISNSGASTTSFTKTGLTNGTAYWFDIRATNSAGNSGDSADVSATPLGPPSAPTGLTATAGNAQVVLAWTNPNNSTITGYSYRQATTQAGLTSATWTAISNSGASTTSFTKTGLTNGTAYWFDIRAVNYSGNSPDSADVSATPLPAPSAPTGLTATAGNAQVVLAWTNPNNSTITGYSYRQATTQAGLTSATWTAISNSGASTTSFTKTGLTNGTAYWFDIRATNSAGNSGDSADVSATPLGPPSAPTGLTATAGNAQVVLAWTNPNNSTITGYSYRQATTQAGLTSATWTAISNSGASTTSFTKTGLTNGTAYWFDIRATNGAGNSADSANVSATPYLQCAGSIGGGGGQVESGAARNLTLTLTQGTISGSASWSTTAGTLSNQSNSGATVTAPAGGAGTMTVSASLNCGGQPVVFTAAPIAYVPPAPVAPANPAAAGGPNSITVSWDAYVRSDITGYQYRYDRGGGFTPWATATPAQASARSITVSGLGSDESVTVEVRALAGSVVGAAASITAVTPPPAPLPTLTPTPVPTPRPPLVAPLGMIVIDIARGGGDRTTEYGFSAASQGNFGTLVSGTLPGIFFADGVNRPPSELYEDGNGWLQFAVADTLPYDWAASEALREVSISFSYSAGGGGPGSGYTLYDRAFENEDTDNLEIVQPWGQEWNGRSGQRATLTFGLRQPHLYVAETGAAAKEPVARPGSFWEMAQERTPGGPVTFQLAVTASVAFALLIGMAMDSVRRRGGSPLALRWKLLMMGASLVLTPWFLAVVAQQGHPIAAAIITLIVVLAWLGWRQLARQA